jgi:1,4-dihydroxy-2-naphthoate octaprenyltransferase
LSTREECDVLDVISKWLISTRAVVFIMTEIAAGIGGIPAWPLYLSIHASQYNKRFGALFLLGLILDVIPVKTGVY